MNRTIAFTVAALLAAGFTGLGCDEKSSSSSSGSTAASTSAPSAAAPSAGANGSVELAADKDQAMAVAEVKPSGVAKDEKVTGTVTFAKAEHGLKVMVDLKGFKPDSKHGFHIHEKADLSGADLKTAGPHFDPGMTKQHGGTDGDMRHGGDLGNITADADGNVKAEITAHGVTLDGEKDGVIGRSVIVHAKADDLKSQPAGDSGDRIAGGKIEKAEK